MKFEGWLWGFALPLFLIPLDLNQGLASARAELGEEEYDRLYEEGKRLTPEQAVDLAQGVDHE